MRQRAFRFFSEDVLAECNRLYGLVAALRVFLGRTQNVRQSLTVSGECRVFSVLSASRLVAMSRHHLADDSGIPISNYKQDFGSIRVVR